MPVASAEDLYGLPLDEFTSERKELAKRLRSEGEKEEAARVAKLRKPSTAAWAVNQLVRTQKKAIGELFEAGDEMIDAQSQAIGGKGSADALKAAARKQRDATTKLLEAAGGLLSSDGHELPASVQERVSETLRAAAIDPESREQVSDGCLVKELRFTGLAGFAADAQTSAQADRAKEKRERETALRAAKDEQSEAERELKHAQRRLEAAEQELTQAERSRARAAKAVEAAEQALDEARERTDQLQRGGR
jgi:hypothetical protein